MNVIGARPDGWWRDRTGAALRLLERLQPLAERAGTDVTLVLDGHATTGLPEGRVGGIDVTYARRGGRDSGDDRVVEVVRDLLGSHGNPTITVATSDRGLADRVRSLGAVVEGAGGLRSRLEH